MQPERPTSRRRNQWPTPPAIVGRHIGCPGDGRVRCSYCASDHRCGRGTCRPGSQPGRGQQPDRGQQQCHCSHDRQQPATAPTSTCQVRRSVRPHAAERHGGAALRTGPVGVELLGADHVGRSALRTDRLQPGAQDVNDFAHPAAGWSRGRTLHARLLNKVETRRSCPCMPIPKRHRHSRPHADQWKCNVLGLAWDEFGAAGPILLIVVSRTPRATEAGHRKARGTPPRCTTVPACHDRRGIMSYSV